MSTLRWISRDGKMVLQGKMNTLGKGEFWFDVPVHEEPKAEPEYIIDAVVVHLGTIRLIDERLVDVLRHALEVFTLDGARRALDLYRKHVAVKK